MATRWWNRAASLAVIIVLCTSVNLSTGCSDEIPNNGRIQVMVTILPLVEFAEAIGGDSIDVRVMVPPGASPHTYEPTPSQMTAMEKADVFIAVGSGIEFELNWLEKLLAFNPSIHLIDCSVGIELIEGTEHEHGHEEEGHSNDHDDDHSSLDPHIWMSPINARTMVQNIYHGLVEFDRGNQHYYAQNLEAYLKIINQLHHDFEEGFKNVKRRTFMIQHPSMGYFAKDYNLVQLAIEHEGKDPTPAGLVHLIDQAREHDITMVFVSPQFNPNYARSVASEIGGVVTALDGLAKNYVQNMQEILDIMLEAMN